jgi:hypothetical protein
MFCHSVVLLSFCVNNQYCPYNYQEWYKLPWKKVSLHWLLGHFNDAATSDPKIFVRMTADLKSRIPGANFIKLFYRCNVLPFRGIAVFLC